MKHYQSPMAFISILAYEDILTASDTVIPTIKNWDGNEQSGKFTDLF